MLVVLRLEILRLGPMEILPQTTSFRAEADRSFKKSGRARLDLSAQLLITLINGM